MLQPRVQVQGKTPWKFGVVLCSFLLTVQSGFAQYSSDEPYIVEPTPALKLNDDADLTTVLLVNNDNRAAHGRYLNVKPAVGLLTSTARTFIQEGVTTEYATQVLGTTLDNGRLYAQLLKKSSRVLYDKDTVTGTVSTVTGRLATGLFSPQKSLLQSHNDLVADQDWQLIDDHLLVNPKGNLNTFVRNTDFIAPIDNPSGALLVFPTRAYMNERIEQQSENRNKDLLVIPYDMNVNGDRDRQLKVVSNESYSISKSSSSSTSKSGGVGQKIVAHKVQPTFNLPTFTVKNVFAPSGFSWEAGAYNDNEKGSERTQDKPEFRSPKLLYHKMTDDDRMLSTVTYYGFADFTTIVGDTVIVFSPSTSSHSINPEHITSIKGEATLGAHDASYVTHVPITVIQDLIEPTFTHQTIATVIPYERAPIDMRNEQQKEGIQENTETTYHETDPEYNEEDHQDADFMIPETTLEQDGDEKVHEQTTSLQEPTTLRNEEDTEDITEGGSRQNLDLESSMVATEDVSNDVTPVVTESSTIKMLSTPSNEDILKIYASLASAEAAKRLATETSSQKEEQEKEQAEKESEIKIFGGATTIFFEDDPFQAFETPKPIDPTTVQPNEVEATEKPSETRDNQGEVERTTENDKPVDATTVEEKTTTDENSTDAVQEDTTEEKSEEATTTIDDENQNANIDSSTDSECIQTSELVWTQQPKTLTYLTTFFLAGEGDEMTTSIKSDVVTTFDILSSTKFNCQHNTISPTRTGRLETLNTESADTVIERPSDVEKESVAKDTATDTGSVQTTSGSTHQELESLPTTTPMIIVTEKAHVTEAGGKVIEQAQAEEEEDEGQDTEDDGQQSGEEIELIYKTLYTTYTYLTTFFHDSTTSISSRKEIVTNVVTSTVSPSMLKTDLDVTDILSSMTIQPTSVLDDSEVSPTTSVGIGRPTTKFVVPQSDLIQIDDILREDVNTEPTEILDSKNIGQNGIKTLYTTYTYYTTIFVDGETEVMSRTEVHTNYISGSATQTNPNAQEKIVVDTVSDEENVILDIKPTASYETIQRSVGIELPDSIAERNDFEENDNVDGITKMSYSTLTRSRDSEVVTKLTEENTQIVENKDVVTMVTDVRSSSSDGDRHIIENISKQWNALLEDQISSESNTEDILPSPTLLLQTSYTTFTFYTTMYSGTATNVVSRLETITNVVTETLQPTQTMNVEDATLPITYFTTYTYWTTLAKDGQITTISREETVSNIVTPTAAMAIQPSTIEQVIPTKIADNQAILPFGDVITFEDSKIINDDNTVIESDKTTKNEPTTFYTTYTYYTTSYAGEDTIINSRFETVTNIVTPTPTISGRAIDITGNSINKIDSKDEKSPIKSEPVFISHAKVDNLDLKAATSVGAGETPTLPQILNSNVVALNKGKIVDAEGISTIFYTTQAIASTIDGKYTEITQSMSSISVDEIKKALSTSDADPSTKTYKTGLVRLIEGTMIANKTTTLYQSKVIGTVIDGRYAQIIESTSSFLIEKTLAPSTGSINIAPTVVQSVGSGGVLQTVFTAAPSADAVESSINEGKDDQENQTEISVDDDEDDGGVDENGRPRSRLTFSTRKRTFTPVIRPFASRNRPQFAPKRKNLTPGSATIITRSDFTPTITATPALKPDSSRGRFSSIRKSSSPVLSSTSGSISGSSRRFSRPRSSASGGFSSSSAFPSGSRNRLSSSRNQIQPTSSYFGISSRRGGNVGPRGGSSAGRFSSAYLGNSRVKIKPTSASSLDSSPNTNIYTTQETDVEEESSTQHSEDANEDEDAEITTENTRRNQNPLLRFRRPPLVSKTPTRAGQISTRRNPLAQRAKTTASTTTTTTTSKPRPRAFQRPPLAGFQNRPRPQSNLFPPRGLFRAQNINQDLEEDNKKPEEENEFGDDLDTEGGDYEDDDGDEEDDDEEGENRRRRRNSEHVKRRSKRQTDYGTRNFRNRFRRPTSARTVVAEDRIDLAVEEELPTTKARTTGRYTGRNHPKTSPTHASNTKRIRPTKPTGTSRAQFTLREKDTATKPSRSSNFRRPTTTGISTRRVSTTIGRPKAPRLKSYTSSVTETTYTPRSTSGRSRQTTSRGRSTTRSRGRTSDYQINDPILPSFDGTITITHHIPTEITIPVVNGKLTEYKNVVTAKISTEIVGPNQYNTLIGRNGNSVLVLSREQTNINNNGATEVTQFILHESPTTSIVFTPTTIRGRRTSFSHIIPSTVYDVESVVSTIQPQINPNSPLANILLSQLLLGNIGLQQQNLNPLIGLGAQPAVTGTPTTEFKTRTTTYVTTVTSEMSTVIPLTFRGKEILTTIVDSSVNIITATEFLTDTIVVTPTMQPVQQVNSLLLPLLLQQQVQAQQNPLLTLQNGPHNDLGGQQLLFQDSFQDLESNRIHKVNLDDYRDIKENEEFPEQEAYQEKQEQQAQPATHHRKRHRKGPKQASAAATAHPSTSPETSVITLYVSGRRPGEFSTVLSTVVTTPESTLHKREIEYPIEKSATFEYEDMYSADGSEIKEFLLPAINEISSSQEFGETQSLESIVGDVSRWFEMSSAQADVVANHKSIDSTTGNREHNIETAKIFVAMNSDKSEYFLV